jgi:hypothetical protein
MLPEPTLAKPPASPAVSCSWVMTPLFCIPDICDSETIPSRTPGYRGTGAARRTSRRPNSRPAQARGTRALVTVKPAPRKETTELLAVTAERLRRALARSFLRYNITGDLESAVHAAMNVIEPVLQARDTEITRLRGVVSGKAARR